MSSAARKADWYVPTPHPAVTKLDSFKKLQNGWAFGEGIAFPPLVLLRAEQIIERLVRDGYNDIDIFPGRDGQIVVTAYGHRVSFDLSICDDAEAPVTLTCEVDGDECGIANGNLPRLSMDSALLLLGDLLKRHSSHQVTAPVYQSSNLSVQSVNQVQSAPTLRFVTAA